MRLGLGQGEGETSFHFPQTQPLNFAADLADLVDKASSHMGCGKTVGGPRETVGARVQERWKELIGDEDVGDSPFDLKVDDWLVVPDDDGSFESS